MYLLRQNGTAYLLIVLGIDPGFLLLDASPSLPTLFGVVAVFGLLNAIGGATAILTRAEIFPVAVRATAMSLTYALGVAVVGGFGPFIVTWMIGDRRCTRAVVVCDGLRSGHPAQPALRSGNARQDARLSASRQRRATMQLPADILASAAELTAIRRDIHAHPEVGFTEARTASLIARKLAEWGVETHTGIGGTGVVGVIEGAGPGPAIGLRADMDALPMAEAAEVPYRSRTAGVFHGCGHDGHTTMLLGAARHLAADRRFPGRIVLIFQPAEEGLGGAAAMIADGLFERFPCREVYGLHNWPAGRVGEVTVKPGIATAASDSFDITITGRGGHAAQPHLAIDPVVVATTLAHALQSVVSRNVNPLRSAILSITRIEAGSAYNVIPDSARLAGTIRSFEPEVRELVHARLREIARGIAIAFAATIEVAIHPGYRPVYNHPNQAAAALDIASEVVGVDLAHTAADPLSGSEDFADMLAAMPGAYLLLHAGPGPGLHNPSYVFNDDILPIGAALLARLATRRAEAVAAGAN